MYDNQTDIGEAQLLTEDERQQWVHGIIPGRTIPLIYVSRS